MKIIINADDCGISPVVDKHIEIAILKGKISSTSIIANMVDLKGAASLYNNYHNQVSFGWHINLTEGRPLLYSQLLLDYGFYIESDGFVVFNGLAYKKKYLPSDIRKEIMKELEAQYEVLRDNGIIPSHIDSHHHIHTSLWCMIELPSFLHHLGILRMRNIYNNVHNAFGYRIRKAWSLFYKSKGFVMPDILSSYKEFHEGYLNRKGRIVELECHPGHVKYSDEEALLLADDTIKDLINYNNIFYARH